MTPYEEIPALNWSSLKHIHTSPLLYRWRADHPQPDTDAFRLGRALHCAVLEPERWLRDYVGRPHFGDGRTKAAQAAKADWLASLPGDCEVLSADEYRNITMAANAVRSHRVAGKLLAEVTRFEEVITWTDPETGIACKGRVDCFGALGLIDLKGAREISARFTRDAAGFLYHGQLAYYHDGAIAAGSLPPSAERPIIIAVQPEEPYDVGCYRLHETALEAGRALKRELLRRFVVCQAADLWPGAVPDLVDLVLPGWAAGMSGYDESEVL